MRKFKSLSTRCLFLFLCTAALIVNAVPVSAHHGGAHILRVYTLVCWLHNDVCCADEPYLKLAGNRIWTGPDCNPVEGLSPGVDTTFWNQASLQIMEDDTGPDDTIGGVVVGPQNGQGTVEFIAWKWQDGVGYVKNYSMEFEVTQ